MAYVHKLLRVKLRPLTQLLLLAGLAAAAFAGLGMSIVRDERDQDTLASQIELGEHVLASATAAQQGQAELEARLNAAQQELAAAEDALPSTLDGKEVLEMILARVGESGVRLMRIDTRPPVIETTEGEEGHEYTVLGFDLDVEGSFRQVIALLTTLEDGTTGTIAVGKFDLREVEGTHVLSLELLAYARAPTAEDSSAEDGTPTDEPAAATGETEGTAAQ